jgi:chemotaxis family two-component system response regulator Rcp1
MGGALGGKLKILLVEDDLGDVRLLKEAVRSAGYDCIIDHATNGKDALEYLHCCGTNVDVVITDINMHTMDGKELLKKIKNHHTLKELHVAILTTSSDEKDKLYCENNGAAQFHTKPTDHDAYELLIKNIFDYWMTVIFGSSQKP